MSHRTGSFLMGWAYIVEGVARVGTTGLYAPGVPLAVGKWIARRRLRARALEKSKHDLAPI